MALYDPPTLMPIYPNLKLLGVEGKLQVNIDLNGDNLGSGLLARRQEPYY
jgi:hypothetical protein